MKKQCREHKKGLMLAVVALGFLLFASCGNEAREGPKPSDDLTAADSGRGDERPEGTDKAEQDESAENVNGGNINGAASRTVMTPQMAEGRNRQYYVIDNHLFCYDEAAREMRFMCQDLQCRHDSYVCPAYLYDTMAVDEKGSANCLGKMIFCYENSLYMIERDAEKDVLIAYDDDFMKKRVVCTLAKDGSRVGATERNAENTAVVYDGYLYYLSVDCGLQPLKAWQKVKLTCSRVEIKNKAVPEKLGEFDAIVQSTGLSSVSNAKVCVSEGMVYFINHTEDSSVLLDKSKAWYQIYRYQPDTASFDKRMFLNTDNIDAAFGEEVGRVVNFSGNCCIDKDGNLYTFSYTGYWIRKVKLARHDLQNNGAAKIVYEQQGTVNPFSVTCDGTYLYFYESSKNRLCKLTTEGELAAEIAVDTGNISNAGICIYGDSPDYLTIACVQKTSSGTDDIQWIGRIAKQDIGKKECPVDKIYSKTERQNQQKEAGLLETEI